MADFYNRFPRAQRQYVPAVTEKWGRHLGQWASMRHKRCKGRIIYLVAGPFWLYKSMKGYFSHVFNLVPWNGLQKMGAFWRWKNLVEVSKFQTEDWDLEASSLSFMTFTIPCGLRLPWALIHSVGRVSFSLPKRSLPFTWSTHPY